MGSPNLIKSPQGGFFVAAGQKGGHMAEENVQEEQELADEPQGAETDETDWKAEARKWENRAKKSLEAEKELEQLKQSQLTEQEKANERAAKAEAELKELKAKAELEEAASSAADKLGVPVEAVKLLIGCNDPEELETRMERLLKILPAYPTRTDDGGGKAAAKETNADRFAKALFGE